MVFLFLITHEDVEKIECIFFKHERPLYYFILSIVKDYHLAEDALQNTFYRIIKNIERIDNDPIRAKNYIYAIARNAAIDIYNEINAYKIDTVSYDDNFVSIDDFQDKEIVANTKLDILEECLPNLSEAERELIALKYEMNLSDKQIASILSISDTAVRQRAFRARKHLVKLIEEFQAGRAT